MAPARRLNERPAGALLISNPTVGGSSPRRSGWSWPGSGWPPWPLPKVRKPSGPSWALTPRVHCTNLYRWTKVFVSGSEASAGTDKYAERAEGTAEACGAHGRGLLLEGESSRQVPGS